MPMLLPASGEELPLPACQTVSGFSSPGLSTLHPQSLSYSLGFLLIQHRSLTFQPSLMSESESALGSSIYFVLTWGPHKYITIV